MKNACVVLSRGYTDIESYTMLIQRNRYIKQHVLVFDNDPDMIIFHQGNITQYQQNYINDASELDINYVNIESVWNKSIPGYHAMCRFYSYYMWQFLQEYDSVFRVDDDCWITQCTQDPFLQLGSNILLRSAYWSEDHYPTNQTLPKYIENLIDIPQEIFYNQQFPYTNVMLSKVDFWLDPHINFLLKTVTLSDEQLAYRWGDLPIIGSLLNIFAKSQVGKLDGMKYRHRSHNNIIDCTAETGVNDES